MDGWMDGWVRGLFGFIYVCSLWMEWLGVEKSGVASILRPRSFAYERGGVCRCLGLLRRDGFWGIASLVFVVGFFPCEDGDTWNRFAERDLVV